MNALRTLAFVLGLVLVQVLGFGAGALAAPTAQTDSLAVDSGDTRLPPGWCYSDAIGTYECKFKIRFPIF